MADTGVLVMAYGTPASLDEVDAYYTDIRGGRPPSEELLEELTNRYQAIGGKSPLLEITRSQVAGIDDRLPEVEAYLGQKHAAPFIADAVRDIAADSIARLVGLVLAPHYSALSVGDYERRARAALVDAGWEGSFKMIESWHLTPGYIDLLVDRVRAALTSLSDAARAEGVVVFTAHSLPEKILENGDPYATQLRETAEAVAEQARLPHWQTAWQSAGRTQEQWLGPDLLEVIRSLAAQGAPGIVVCPCGFVADHLEILYDVDIEAQALAEEVGVELTRTQSPNDDPVFLDTLAEVVRRAL